MEELQTFLVAVTVFLYGTGMSWVQERLPKWDSLPANVKQLINSVITFVLPGVVTIVSPYWEPEFGSIEGVFTSLMTLIIVPLGAWLVSQFAHYFDPKVLNQYRKAKLEK